jgi:uncharacterized protein YwqG
MNFWNKLFAKKSSPSQPSHFDNYRLELDKMKLKTLDDLETLVRPLVRRATKLEVQKPSQHPENSQFISQFGGDPYFEKGEKWPTSKSGKPLQFIFQVYNNAELELPQSIALIQFFYDWDESAWDTGDDGWLVKIYDQTSKDGSQLIGKPDGLEISKYCDITFQSTFSLPDWEGIDLHNSLASKLSCVINEDQPWESYQKIVSKLCGEQNYQSQLGGYPNWVQGESTPKDKDGRPMRLLFQLDSENNAGLMWGDVGLVYVFYEEATGRIEFTLQCH